MGGDSNSHLGPADESNQSPVLAGTLKISN